MQVHSGLAPDSQALIAEHTLRTIEGMSSFLERESGSELQLRDVRDLRDYCYAVAGIVGEMLTELFLKDDDALDRSRRFSAGWPRRSARPCNWSTSSRTRPGTRTKAGTSFRPVDRMRTSFPWPATIWAARRVT